jgi:hypothetical protein
MWWVAQVEKQVQAIQDRWCAIHRKSFALNPSVSGSPETQTSADGDPAAKETSGFRKQLIAAM